MFRDIRNSIRYYLKLYSLGKVDNVPTIFGKVGGKPFERVGVTKSAAIPTVGLGRWTIETCHKKTEYKIDMANRDHCGPCGKYPPKTS